MSAPPLPPLGPMEVVFSFDTTGSMSIVLDEVKARVNDIVQRLQADIPGFRVGIVAHGDYCDAEHFYSVRTLDLTDSVADVVTFVNETEGTGGGDIPECYELALRHVNQMAWSQFSRRVLVVIGDAYPHEPDYDLNTEHIDWREQLLGLIRKGVKIYGVQYQDDATATDFFSKLAIDSGGQHLKLADMSTICQVIMAICYREHGTELFENYEAELRAGAQKNINPDLECAFGALRKETSMTSVSSGDVTLKRANSSAKKYPANNSNDKPDNDADDRPVIDSNDGPVNDSKTDDIGEGSSSDSEAEEMVFSPYHCHRNVKGFRKSLMVHRFQAGDFSKKLKSKVPKRVRKLSGPAAKSPSKVSAKIVKAQAKTNGQLANKTEKRTVKRKGRTPARTSKFWQVPRKKPHFREWQHGPRFLYRNLPWSSWKPAAIPRESSRVRGHWKVLSKRAPNARWRQDLLNVCLRQLKNRRNSTTLFELGVQRYKGHTIEALCFRSTNICRRTASGVFGLPWYTGLFRRISEKLTQALLQKCRVFIRWAIIQRGTVAPRAILRDYNYAWVTGRPIVIDGCML